MENAEDLDITLNAIENGRLDDKQWTVDLRDNRSPVLEIALTKPAKIQSVSLAPAANENLNDFKFKAQYRPSTGAAFIPFGGDNVST